MLQPPTLGSLGTERPNPPDLESITVWIGVPLDRRQPSSPQWWTVATAGWLRAALARGVIGAECTFDVIDSRRDADPEYAGSVRIGDQMLDLLLDEAGCVRVCDDGRYHL